VSNNLMRFWSRISESLKEKKWFKKGEEK
jgi:hypothetical protein